MSTISFSEASTLADCEQKWHYRYVEKPEKGPPGKALVTGTLFHAGANMLYETGFISVAAGLDAIAAVANEEGFTADQCETAQWLIHRYFSTYKDEPYTNYLGEQRIEVPMPGWDVTVVAIIDGLKWDDLGRLWVVERKTAGKPTEALELASISPQVTLYDWAVRVGLGVEPYGVEYDVANTYQWKNPRPDADSFSRRYLDRTEEQRNIGLNWLDSILLRRNDLQAPLLREPIRNVSRSCLYCPYRYPCLEGFTFDPVEMTE